MTRAELAGVISEDALHGVIAFLFDSLGQAPVTAIVVRRTYAEASAAGAQWAGTCTRGSPCFREGTVAVALNADDDVEGGALYVLARDGPVEAPGS